MLSNMIRRFGEMIFVLIGISAIVFLIFFATPGIDPAARMAGRNASPETLIEVRKDFGLDKPLPVQYAIIMKKLFITQDLSSFANRGTLIVPEIMEAAPVTLSLVVLAAIIWLGLSTLIGLMAAAFQGTVFDRLLMMLSLIGVSLPVFWLGELVNLVSQSRFHDSWMFSWVPPLGYTPITQDPFLWFKGMILPSTTLAVMFIGIYGRTLRSSLIEAMQQDYIRTARAKGLSETAVLLRHALRTSLVTFVTLFGLDFGALVGGGALLTEVVFGLPGVGRLTYNGLLEVDLPTIMAVVIYASCFIVVSNAVVDILYAILDPRARHGR
ncbi:ABC transporter permease [Allorhizobium sp. BGMRC 0089]|uniref:ABC transporter permease n=1 Tax=Allorhizobium sonneratiae TaxID=2934936 RepID=UPI002033E896|nr:ABC transporter permease [Allorhizobium sonneratiae]MCM2293130.1 ABC transporter permease [Allorhizobium sonneratiae]